MHGFAKQWDVSLRWLRCGSRLFARNPWLLGGMGAVSALLISVLLWIPLLGALLVAALAPILLTSLYLNLDEISRQKLPLPPALRRVALRQSPRKLFDALQDEARLVPMLVAGIYSLGAALLINILVRAVVGGDWESRWADLAPLALIGVLAMGAVALVLYSVLAASLIYTLPLGFLLGQPLLPAVARSLRSSYRYAGALLVLLVVFLTPFVLGAAAAILADWLMHLVWWMVGAALFPLVAASLYCSYRTIFTAKADAPQTPPGARR